MQEITTPYTEDRKIERHKVFFVNMYALTPQLLTYFTIWLAPQTMLYSGGSKGGSGVRSNSCPLFLNLL